LISRKAKFAVAGAALALLLAGVAGAQAETLYVIEQLVVSVNSLPDGSGERIAQIHSGDQVEVLERQDDQSHVRLASGQEGWVRSSYLSPNPPLREQLKARTEELEKLRQEKTKLEADLASARKAASAAMAASAAPAPATTAAPAPPASPSVAAQTAPESSTAVPSESEPGATSADPIPSNPPLFSDGGILPSRPSWVLALVTAGIALAVGFALGWRMLDRRIRAKYGGLRIY
jgi:hypothetical protein